VFTTSGTFSITVNLTCIYWIPVYSEH